jgi:iron complex transport system permease protein
MTRQSPPNPPRARGRGIALATLALLLCGALLLGAGVGAMAISPAQIAGILAKAAGLSTAVDFSAGQEAVLLSIRLPRVLLGALVGGALALTGGAMQGLFRNPLADPGLLGVSSGAALAAFAVFVFGSSLLPGIPEGPRALMLPVAAFAGGLCAIFVIYTLSREGGQIRVPTMLMAGIAVNALCGAGIGLFSFLATDAQLRGFTFWSLGSLGGATWKSLAFVAPVFAIAIFGFYRLARPLNLLALGEHEAAHLGAPVERVKFGVAILCALVVGTAVSVSGAISFVGLVVPHLVRMTLGPDHRFLLPASMLGGAALLLVADVIARTLAAPAELPIGILTALVGGPFFLYLLIRNRGSRAWT